MNMKASLIIPFRNEALTAKHTISSSHEFLSHFSLDFELIAVDDSSDGTWEILQSLSEKLPGVVTIKGDSPPGYGKALKKGFTAASGEILIPFNGDLSDSLDDVVAYIRLVEQGYDMVFGSRYLPGATVNGDRSAKNLMSKLGNRCIQWLYRTECSDLTNSFKAYRKEVLANIQLESDGFEINLELALKSIRRGYRYTSIPITWTDRKQGISKMSVAKVIPRYLSTVLFLK